MDVSWRFFRDRHGAVLRRRALGGPLLAAVLSLALLCACVARPQGGRVEEDTVRRLDPAKLHVTFMPGSTRDGPVLPRAYTLTHSDATGDLYLSIGPQYNEVQISGWYTRFLRDEVLAEWLPGDGEGSFGLHVYCHVSGGVVAGTAGWRDAIFRRELPLVLEAFRFGDAGLVEAHPELDNAPVWVHFRSADPRYNSIETWGKLADYR